MDNIAVRGKHKKMPHRQAMHRYQFDAVDAEELQDLFPLPRYFQIHFNHIHENVERLEHQLDELKQSVSRVEDKLDQLLAGLDRAPGL